MKTDRPSHHTPVATTVRKRPPRRWDPLSLSLRGLPELDYFSTDEERAAALREIAGDAGRLSKRNFWLGVAIMIATLVGAQFLARGGFRLVDLPRWLEESLSYACAAAAFVLMLRWLNRSGVPRQLRVKLLARGVPVCVGCGYLLKGLSASTTVCPECGRTFDECVRRILDTAPAPKPQPPTPAATIDV